MKRLFAALVVVVLSLAGVAFAQPVPSQFFPPKDDPVAATLVVYNRADPASTALAHFYAAARGIAPEHMVGLDCPAVEEISREQYDTTIADPLRRIFTERGWWTLTEGSPPRVVESKIRFVALMRGIPLKIMQVAHYDGDSSRGMPPPFATTNQASVDSELACLGFFTRNISGPLRNPYYRAFASIFNTDAASLLLVCRLDGPSDTTVRRMIEDSLATEKTGLWGFAYINERGVLSPGLSIGDEWLGRLRRDAMRNGIPCILQKGPALFAPNYPMRNAALYYGWYSASAVGPFMRPGFRFNRGAVAAHIHSFSAATVRSPTANWVGPLLEHGAAATFGNVYEPYLSFTVNLDVFNDRLMNGFTFAESAYMSENVVSWMTTFVGDPLYRPFKANLDVMAEPPRYAAEWVAYREGALAWFDEGRAAGERKLREAGNRLRSEVIFEGLGLLEDDAGDPAAALKSFDTAEKYCANEDDAMRIIIHEVRLMLSEHRLKDALALVRRAVAEFPDSPALPILRADAGQLPP